jgi:LuxR family transcriptional regulator, maltose regulon positive regulatory protein
LIITQAMAYQAEQNRTRALEELHRSLEMAEPEGIILPFVEHGRFMAELLSTAQTTLTLSPRQRAFLQHLIHRIPDGSRGESSSSTAVPAPVQNKENLVEPLSEREMEVLRLLAEGRSNREIAAELTLALGTVKKHINTIFGKLGVSNRTEAALKARQGGLLK